MLEHVGGLLQQALLVDDLQGLEVAQEPIEPAGVTGQTLQQPVHELAADHRCELDGALAVVPEPIQTRHDDAVHGVGDADLGEALHDAVAVGGGRQHAEVEQGLGHLLDEERHAFRLVEQRRPDLLWHILDPEHPSRDLERLGGVEVAERQVRHEASAAERRRVPDPVSEHHEDRHARHRVEHRLEVVLGGGVHPVQILEDEDQRPPRRASEAQRTHGLEDLGPTVRGVHPRERRVAGIHGEQVADERDVSVQRAEPPHAMLDLGNDLRLAIELLDAEVLPQLVDERPEGDGLAE